MEILDSIDSLRAVRGQLTGRIGLVPTMGALHEGHLSLVREARRENDHVLVTIFVNPTQFGPNEDFNSYPRNLEADTQLLQSVGADYVFTPTPSMMYPDGYQTYIENGEIADGLEGARRAGHFRGVSTVVAKLFNLTQAHRAYFGQKDAQQVAVIRRMVHDLNMPIEVIPCPIVREPDGLAMSSRNAYLTPPERAAASVLYRALNAASARYDAGQRHPESLRQTVRDIIAQEPLATLDYVSAADARTLRELDSPTDAPLLLSLTVKIGKPRLLDNALLPLSLNTRDGLMNTLGRP